MRVDVIAEFFVKVGSSREQVGNAAQTLGRRTLEPESARDLLEGRFASALRTVAAQMTLEELHEQRQDYAQRVKAAAVEGLAQNGLELESVAIVDLDQTNLEFFDSSNAFDAEGLTQLTETIETRRRMRNEIEQRTQVEIRAQNLDAQRKVLDIDREGEYARLAQERDLEVRRTAQRLELAKDRAIAIRKSSRRRSRRAKRSRSRASFRSAISPKRASRTRKRPNIAKSPAAARSTKRRSSRASRPSTSRSRSNSRWRRRASTASASRANSK